MDVDEVAQEERVLLQGCGAYAANKATLCDKLTGIVA